MTRALLYAIGLGAAASVLVALAGLLGRFVGLRLPVGDDIVVVTVAAAVVVAARGTAAGGDVARLALLGLARPATALINGVLGVAVSGRAPGAGTTDALAPLPAALIVLGLALGVGAAAGVVLREYARPPQRRPPESLLVPIGIAYVAGAVVGLVWPASFLGQLLETDLAATLASLPVVVVPPIAGGIAAAREGLGYRNIVLLGVFVILPLLLTLAVGTVLEVAQRGGAPLDSTAAQLRARIVLSWFLVGLRVAAWPLGAAFAQGFLAPPPGRQPETTPTADT